MTGAASRPIPPARKSHRQWGASRVAQDRGQCPEPSEHGEHAYSLSAASRRRLLNDQGGRDAGDQRLEAHRDHADQRERGQGRREGAGEVCDRESGDPDRDQSSPSEAVRQRREWKRAEGAERQHGAEV
jgi:hypothetical protein